MLVSEAFSQFTIYKKDTSDVSQAVFLQWCNTLNRVVYRLISDIDPERYILEVPYSTISSNTPSIQALPIDFKQIQQWGTGFYPLDANGNIIDQKLTLSNPSTWFYGYYLNKGNVIFTAPQTRSYKLRYIPVLTPLLLFSDSFVIPDEYADYVLRALDVLYYQWDEDAISEGISDQRFVRVMSELEDDIRRVPSAYNLPDLSLDYVNLGGYSMNGSYWL